MRMMTRSEFNRHMLRRGGPTRLLLLVEESKVPTLGILPAYLGYLT